MLTSVPLHRPSSRGTAETPRRRCPGGTMNPMISVNDLASGTVSVRPSDTRTLDIPAGFDRRTPVASLDFHSRVQCASTDGGLLRYLAFTSPLSSRAQGEECLVADGP